MTVYLAADHGGFHLKAYLLAALAPHHTVVDCGNHTLDPADDASDYMDALALRLNEDPTGVGIAICKSAGAVTIEANRYAHIRATRAVSVAQVAHDRADDHINVLTLASDFVSEAEALALVETFLQTAADGDARFVRRVDKLSRLGTKL